MYVRTVIKNNTKEGRKYTWIPKHGHFLQAGEELVIDGCLPSIIRTRQVQAMEADINAGIVSVELDTDMDRTKAKAKAPAEKAENPSKPEPTPEPDASENSPFQDKSIDELKKEQGLETPDAGVETVSDVREAAQADAKKAAKAATAKKAGAKASTKTGAKKAGSKKK